MRNPRITFSILCALAFVFCVDIGVSDAQILRSRRCNPCWQHQPCQSCGQPVCSVAGYPTETCCQICEPRLSEKDTAYWLGADWHLDGKCDGNCTAYWKDGFWHVTDRCGDGCHCEVPGVRTRTGADGVTLEEEEEGEANCEKDPLQPTHEKFYVTVSRKATNSFTLCFDLANVPLEGTMKFHSFPIAIKSPEGDKLDFRITATRVSYQEQSEVRPIKDDDDAFLVIHRKSPLGEPMAVTIPFGKDEEDKTILHNFGYWCLKFDYKPQKQ